MQSIVSCEPRKLKKMYQEPKYKSDNRFSPSTDQISEKQITIEETKTHKDSYYQDYIASGNVIPRITKECEDLSALILETKQCVRDILDSQERSVPLEIRKCIPSEEVEKKDISMLVECRQSLMDCLDCLFDIQSYLKRKSTRKKRWTKRRPTSAMMNPDEKFSDKDLRALSSQTFNTPPTSCPCCVSRTVVTSKSSPPCFSRIKAGHSLP